MNHGKHALFLACFLVCVSTGCGSSPAHPLDRGAKNVADLFVRSLVVKGDAKAAARYLDPSAPVDLDRQVTIWARDGVDTVDHWGRIERGCLSDSPFQDGSPDNRGDCVEYQLFGSIFVGYDETQSDATLKVWLKFRKGRWGVFDYEYHAAVDFCAGKCPPRTPSCVLLDSGKCVPLR